MTPEEIAKELKDAGFKGSEADLRAVAEEIAQRSAGRDDLSEDAIKAIVSAAVDKRELDTSNASPNSPNFQVVRAAVDAYQGTVDRERQIIEDQDALSDEEQSSINEQRQAAGEGELSEQETDQTARTALLRALGDQLGRAATTSDVERARAALQGLLGPGVAVTDSMLRLRLEANDTRILDALREDEAYSANQMWEFTDNRTGEKVYVSKGVYDTVLQNLAGAADYRMLTSASFADSVRRGYNNENIYGLLAFSHNLTDPNKSFGELYGGVDVGKQPGVDEPTIRKQFMRQKLQEQGRVSKRIPKRYITLPFGNKVENPAWRLWMNPESAFGEQEWESYANEYQQYLLDRRAAEREAGHSADEGLRMLLYNEKTPQFESYMNSGYGPLAALVATHDPELAKKMMGPGLNDLEMKQVVNGILKGLDPKAAGVISDQLVMYSADFKKAAGGGGGGRTRTIIQPNRDKIREGFLELYRAWFQQDPAEGELEGLIDQVANEFVAAQNQNREPEIQSTSLKAIRSTDLYSQLFGKKPTGLSEEQYIGQFQKAGSNLLGGQMPSSQAVQAGMQANNPNVTTSMVAQDEKSWENSSWLERVYQIAELANRMT